MNKGTKWLTALVAVLVITNLALAASIWLKKEKTTNAAVPPRRDARDFLVKKLALSDAQIVSFDSLRKTHFSRMQAYQEQMRQRKDGLFAQLRWPRNAHADSLAQQIGALQAKMDLETFEHFSQLRSLLNEEQTKTFDNTIQEVLRTMGPKGGPPPQRGDGPPDGRMGPPPPDAPLGDGPPRD